MRALWGLIGGLLLAVLACSSSSPASNGAACSLSSDCAGGLVCAFGECRPPCVTAVDCATGDSCEAFDGGAACVAPEEAGAAVNLPDAASVDVGTTIGILGAACSPPGAQACAGHAQRVVVVCNGTWQVDQTCPAADYCDSRAGLTFATCQPIMPSCANAAPGATVCEQGGCLNISLGVPSPQTEVCGPDLVSQTQGTTCANNACANGACCTSPTAVVCGGCNMLGQAIPGGACTELASDPSNCGACGHACAAGDICTSGMCRGAPIMGDQDAGGMLCCLSSTQGCPVATPASGAIAGQLAPVPFYCNGPGGYMMGPQCSYGLTCSTPTGQCAGLVGTCPASCAWPASGGAFTCPAGGM
jgi:hypothetical protein